MHNLVRVIGTEVDDNLNTDLDTDSYFYLTFLFLNQS